MTKAVFIILFQFFLLFLLLGSNRGQPISAAKILLPALVSTHTNRITGTVYQFDYSISHSSLSNYRPGQLIYAIIVPGGESWVLKSLSPISPNADQVWLKGRVDSDEYGPKILFGSEESASLYNQNRTIYYQAPGLVELEVFSDGQSRPINLFISPSPAPHRLNDYPR